MVTSQNEFASNLSKVKCLISAFPSFKTVLINLIDKMPDSNFMIVTMAETTL